MKEQKSNSKIYELLSCGETSGKIGWEINAEQGTAMPLLNERQDDLPRHQERSVRTVQHSGCDPLLPKQMRYLDE